MESDIEFKDVKKTKTDWQLKQYLNPSLTQFIQLKPKNIVLFLFSILWHTQWGLENVLQGREFDVLQTVVPVCF